MRTYVALLRAVNLGAHGRVSMADLRAVITAGGGVDPVTYVQSGNVVFGSPLGDPREAETWLRQRLASGTGLDTQVMAREAGQLAQVAAAHPFGEGEDDHRKLQVGFLAAEPAVTEVAVPGSGRERVLVRGREVFLHYPDGVGRSKLTTAVLEKQLGTSVTCRNWKTVRALAELAAGRG